MISTVRLQAPLRRIKILERYAGIILNERCSMSQQEVPHQGKIALMQEIGSAFYQAIADSEIAAEGEEAAALRGSARILAERHAIWFIRYPQ